MVEKNGLIGENKTTIKNATDILSSAATKVSRSVSTNYIETVSLATPKPKTSKNRKIGSDAAFTNSAEQPSSYQKRALPIFWMVLEKKGASNLREQQIVLRPVIKLFKAHQLVVIGDREFHSIELAHWLHRQKVKFVFRQKQDTTFQQNRQRFKSLSQVEIYPGMKQFLTNITLTQKKGFGRFNLAIYWKRKYKRKQEQSPWYLLTNLPDCETAVKIYGKRFGIEAMFKDCKTGGYNLEGSQASSDRLVRLVLLIALAMSTAWLQGQHTSTRGQSSYICRPKETQRTRRRHSNFWIGLYGHNWIAAFHLCQEWVQQLLGLIRNKLPFSHSIVDDEENWRELHQH
jgi:hypothetical protein